MDGSTRTRTREATQQRRRDEANAKRAEAQTKAVATMPRDGYGRLVERKDPAPQVVGHVTNDLATSPKQEQPDHGHVQLAGRAGVSEKTAARTQALGNKRPDLLEKVAADKPETAEVDEPGPVSRDTGPGEPDTYDRERTHLAARAAVSEAPAARNAPPPTPPASSRLSTPKVDKVDGSTRTREGDRLGTRGPDAGRPGPGQDSGPSGRLRPGMGNGTNGGSPPEANGTTGGSNGGTNGSPPAGWSRVSDLADELGRSGRWVRQWVGDNLPAGLYDRFPRPAGGAPELWAAPDAVAQLRDRFANGTTGGSPPEANGATAEPPAEPPEVREDGWRAAADAERRRADAAEDRLDALRLELGTVREALVQAERRAEEADRGRHAAELRLEALRGDVWSWVALVRGLAWWRRLRHLPDPPPSLVAHERLLAKPEE